MTALTVEQQAAIDAAVEAIIAKAGLNKPATRFTPGVSEVKDLAADRPWSSFGEQLLAVKQAFSPGGIVDKRLVTKAAGASEGVPSDGGFLVSPEYSAELLTRTYETGIIASRCRRIPMSSSSNQLKIKGVDETSRATGSRWGGVVAYWGDEGGTKTASRPKFREIAMSLQKLTGLFYATDELLEDAAALDSIVGQAFSEEFAWQIDDCIVDGTGAGQPLGILRAGCAVSVAKETGQAAATILSQNVIKMWSRMWGRSRANAIWLINQDIEPQLYAMYMAVGTGGIPVYLPAGGLSAAPFGTLFGRPVIPVEQCKTLGTLGDIIAADFSQYLIIDKGAMQNASSIHVRFIYDETTFRFVLRIDGQPAWNATLTPANGTNTVSPYVSLAARA